ncbi:hypothetical protein GEV33_012815 [Tenebrio molitor]|uniref:Uncharacterized protein n=1 Tax=Tenebrio molitor TaxID=7067 RepID=A0A8J6H8D9_TENMO|nr:hypothetical protein GEV33_012815 [Tenebrio molitor]
MKSADSNRSPPRSLPTSRQLQRKLEARIEHARRLHQEYHTTPGLIPIQRLPIPGAKDHQPLVQWDTDDSEEDIVNFFPLSRKESRIHQELTDTFSIEEMSISGDDEEEEDLHLVPPQTVYKKFACSEHPRGRQSAAQRGRTRNPRVMYGSEPAEPPSPGVRTRGICAALPQPVSSRGRSATPYVERGVSHIWRYVTPDVPSLPVLSPDFIHLPLLEPIDHDTTPTTTPNIESNQPSRILHDIGGFLEGLNLSLANPSLQETYQ